MFDGERLAMDSPEPLGLNPIIDKIPSGSSGFAAFLIIGTSTKSGSINLPFEVIPCAFGMRSND